ncbi:MAG: MscL family protein, partial [Akkermansia sp.]|nr:MscL family protein [Akkermansia sp.]
NFLQTVVDFLIIALSIFFAVRLICKIRFRKKEEEAQKPVEAPAPPPTPEDILLLREIRDALKNK